MVLVIPGLGQPSAQWKRTLSLLRGIEAAPRLGAGRPTSASGVEKFISHMPELMGMSQKERAQLASDTLVAEVPGKDRCLSRRDKRLGIFYFEGGAGAGYSRMMSMSF